MHPTIPPAMPDALAPEDQSQRTLQLALTQPAQDLGSRLERLSARLRP